MEFGWLIDGTTAALDSAVLGPTPARGRHLLAGLPRLKEVDRRRVVHALAEVERTGDLSSLRALLGAKRARRAELQALGTPDARSALRYELQLLSWLWQLLGRLAEEPVTQRQRSAGALLEVLKSAKRRQPVITAVAPAPRPEASPPDGVRGSPALVAQAA